MYDDTSILRNWTLLKFSIDLVRFWTAIYTYHIWTDGNKAKKLKEGFNYVTSL